MADTVTTETPIDRGLEAFRKNGLAKDATPPKASEIDLANFDITDPELWRQGAYWDYFARMRKEAPINYCPESPFGPYWNVTTYKDIMTVDTTHGVFSSEGGITVVDQDEDFQLPMFIAMDPPKHDLQRKTVQSIVGPDNLRSFEALIRSRTTEIFDSLDISQPFDWVDKVSIELTTMMLATLFDFPFEDRRKLTRWSDVATGRSNPDIVTSEEQWRGELMECLGYFTKLWNERVNAEPQGRPHFDAGPWRAHAKHVAAGISRQPDPADRRRQRHDPQLDDGRRLRHEQVAGELGGPEGQPESRAVRRLGNHPLADAARSHAPHCA